MKRRVFEEIIQAEFRWPTAGDQAFVAAHNPLENANIADDEFTRLVLMMEGYRKAADLMVAQTISESADRDFLVCPIIFNYRQFIELSLKYIIATYGPVVRVAANWNTHDLETLWNAFKGVLDAYGTSDPDDADPVVAQLVAEFAKIVPGSYSHRYPVDRQGKPLPLAVADLHLPTLADVMDGVAGYFTGCDGYLSEVKGAMP
jgi:hypothetical protein